MSVPRKESEGPRHSPEVDQTVRLYQSVRADLGSVLTRDFLMAADEAERLVDEAICVCLQTGIAEDKRRPWCIASILAQAEKVYRKRAAEEASAEIARKAERAREIVRLRRGLEQLPAKEQEAVRLYMYEGWPVEAIAEKLNWSEAAARRLIAIALKKLR